MEIISKKEIIQYQKTPEVVKKEDERFTFGLEQEFFIQDKDNKFVLGKDTKLASSDLDNCGWLAEARSSVYADPWLCFGSLLKSVTSLEQILLTTGHKLIRIPFATLPKELLYQAGRAYGKGIQEDACLYGEVKATRNQTAGLHIHFGYPPKNVDLPKVIKYLDTQFSSIIKGTHRQLGLYEMKSHGFEYRSLPNTTELLSILPVIEKAKALL